MLVKKIFIKFKRFPLSIRQLHQNTFIHVYVVLTLACVYSFRLLPCIGAFTFPFCLQYCAITVLYTLLQIPSQLWFSFAVQSAVAPFIQTMLLGKADWTSFLHHNKTMKTFKRLKASIKLCYSVELHWVDLAAAHNVTLLSVWWLIIWLQQSYTEHDCVWGTRVSLSTCGSCINDDEYTQ